jgi:NADH dehydrogenase/NADH:ubiquinone oxidoreductase subunit G
MSPNSRGFREDSSRPPQKEENSGDRQDDEVCDDQDQKFNQPIDETTNPMNAAYLSTAVGEKTHRFTACLIQKAVEEHSLVEDYIGGKERHGSLKTYEIESPTEWEMQPTDNKESSLFNEAYKGDVSKLFDKPYKENVANKSATDTLRSGYSLTDIDADKLEDEDEEPPGEHDDQDPAKLFKDMTEVQAPLQKTMKEGEIAPLAALYPTMRVLSDGEKPLTNHRMSTMHMNSHEIAPLDALYPMMRVLSDSKKQQTFNRMSAKHESTYQ